MSDLVKRFDTYHAACVIDGERDGLCSDWFQWVQDACSGSLDGVTWPELHTHVETFIADQDPSDCDESLRQHDAEECIPEIAVQCWFEGFCAGVRRSVAAYYEEQHDA